MSAAAGDTTTLLVTAAEMRALDRETIDVIGVPGAVLMETAGRGVVDVLGRVCELGRTRVAIFCGPGNNGGDGFVVARHLANRGVAVAVGLVGARARIGGDAKVHFDACVRSGVSVHDDWHAVPLAPGDVAVDALLGTGLGRAVEGELAAVIMRLNAHGAAGGLVVAVDIPSGLDGDRGVALGDAVRARHTVTFAFAKLGLANAPGFTYAGEVHVVDIGIPATRALAHGVQARLLGEDVLAPHRALDPLGHKGSHGHVLVVAGSRGKTGAALLCGTAALRAGAGLCTVAMPRAAAEHAEGRVPELMIEGYRDDDQALADVAPLVDGKKALAVGPGVPRAPWMRALLGDLCTRTVPMVIDADGLNHLAEAPGLLGQRAAATVLTPHPGEAARLLGTTIAVVQADRVAHARALASRFGVVAVLKGARTVIAAPDGKLAICPTGNPGLGTGGTGDVLTGCVAAFLARTSDDPFAAASAAVYLHGAAGDRAAAARGMSGLLAGDVIDALPSTLAAR